MDCWDSITARITGGDTIDVAKGGRHNGTTGNKAAGGKGPGKYRGKPEKYQLLYDNLQQGIPKFG